MYCLLMLKRLIRIRANRRGNPFINPMMHIPTTIAYSLPWQNYCHKVISSGCRQNPDEG
jgi:hypothetical protein